LAAGVGALAAAALSAGHASAEAGDSDGGRTVDSVTVTATRAEHPYVDLQAPYKTDRLASDRITQDLLDLSKSVTVLSNQVIHDSGATSFRDLMRTQPGVTLGTGEGGNAYGDRIFIRGFDARDDVYVDGVRDPGVGSRETFAVEQVEIMKGPSSTFGGRGTTGGAVNLVSKQARDMDFTDVEATVGTDRTRRLTVDVNRALGDKLAVRVNAMVHGSDVARRDDVFNDRWGVAAAVRYQPTSKLVLSADYYHLDTDEMPDWGVPYDLAHNRPFQVDPSNFYGVLARDFRRTFADIATARVEFDPGGRVQLRSIFRYGRGGNAYTASAPERPDPVAGTVSANAKRRDATTDYLVNQTEATVRFDTGPVGHALVAGVEVSRERILNRGRATTECASLPCAGGTSNPLQDLYHPDPGIAWTVADDAITSLTRTRVNSRAAYALDTLRLGEHWQLLGGVRYDIYDADLSQTTLATGAVSARTANSRFWNWHVGLTYKPVPNGSLYVSYGSSSNPSGEQLDATAFDYGGLDPRTVDLAPERNRAVELGTKWNVFHEHLNLSAALFRIDKDNARMATAPGRDAPVALVGHERAQGIEFGASGAVSSRLSVFGGLTLLDAKITDSPIASQIGAKFPNVPDVSFTLTGRYQVTNRAYLGGTANYNGRKYGGTLAAQDTQAPGYWRFDLFGGYQITRRVAVSVNLLNLTDKVYYDALYRSATPFVYVAPGRSALLKLDYEF
jgi:catecholate siderophore receptor